MNLHGRMLTKNACFKAGKTIVPKGIMIHSTGVNNPYLKRYVGPDDGLLGVNQYDNHWNRNKPGGRAVCVHAFIGKLKDGSVATYQTLPWHYRGWHAGGKANKTHIGFEICEDLLLDTKYFNAVYQEAVELCVHLCKLYNLTEKDIIGHYEGYQRGIASNHKDPKHWISKHGKSMDTIRLDVKKALEKTSPFPQPDGIYDTYIVAKGDSLWKIALKTLGSGVRYQEIKTLNGLTSDNLYIGQRLKIPRKA